ncbi:phage tail protein [Acetanaerobacterium elongatum]|uniref:Phage-related protein n=1 Tax=Acetanaerobacterium elongatum TaxID=258515 RepID=A0A1H0E9P7_9FIRM|nr:phage tail protein [Acetanaerobacterium elongatum]SDN79154.1 hypothetical protein SAMN05192585_13228 [Acetanaerobacterium elongatum]
MADDFGLKIGIEGEKEFKNALREINQSFKVLGSEMNLVSSQFDKQDKSVEALSARNSVLNKEIDEQKNKIETLEKALANAATSFGENDRRTQSWAIQLNNAKAALNGMEREQSQLSVALEQNSKELNTAGNEFNDAEKQARQFGDEVKKSGEQSADAGGRFEKLGGVLKGIGAAMATAFAAIGTAAVGAAKTLTDMTVGAAAYADEILTMSTVTGMSAQSLQGYKYAAELVDVSLDTLTGSMAKQIKSMDAARDGNKQMAGAYEKLGISVTNADGSLRNSETVYWEAIDALGKMKEGAERDALSMQIFGKSAQELNPLIAQGSEGIAALTEEARRMGAVMSDESIAKLGKFDDSVQRLKAGSSAAKNALGMVLLPQLQLIADEGVALLGDFTRGLNEAGGDWGKISDVIGSTMGGIANMILQSLPQIIDTGMEIVGSIGNAVIDNLPMLIDTASQMIFTLLQGLISALPQMAEGALQLVLSLVNGIITNLPALVQAAITMMVTLATGIGQALPELIPAIVQAIITIVETLIANLDKILEAAFAIMEGLVTGLLNALPLLIDALPRIIEEIINFITNNLPKMVDMGIKLIVQLAEGLIKAIPQLVASIPQIISALVNGLGNAVQAVQSIGVDIVKGLWEGIKSMSNWLLDMIGRFFGDLIDGIKEFLGIHSPSRVFAGIGANMAQGLAAGFVKAMNAVTTDIQSAIPTNLDVSGHIAYATAPAQGSALSPQSGIQVVQNIYTPQYDYVSLQREAARQFRQAARMV